VHSLLLQRRDGHFLLMLWLEVASGDTQQSQAVTLILDGPAIVNRWVPYQGTSTALGLGMVFPVNVLDDVSVLEVIP